MKFNIKIAKITILHPDTQLMSMQHFNVEYKQLVNFTDNRVYNNILIKLIIFKMC